MSAVDPGRRAAREAARRAQARRSTAIAGTATIVVLGALVAIVLTAPGWPTLRDAFFSGHEFSDAFGDILSGFWLDVRMFVIVEILVLALGLAIALCRTSRAPWLFPLKLVAVVFTDLFRGIPTLLLVYMVGFGVPALQGGNADTPFILGLPLPTDPVVLGCAALTINYAAYVGEVFRAGINSVHGGQTAAALSLGLTRTQAMRHVVVPQAVRRVIPPLLNDFISLTKDVSLVSVLGPQEAVRIAQIHSGKDFNYTPYLAAALLYIAITIPLARYVDWMQARARARGEAVAV